MKENGPSGPRLQNQLFLIRTVKEIRIAGRNTQGVRIIKLTGDEKVVSSIKLDDNLV